MKTSPPFDGVAMRSASAWQVKDLDESRSRPIALVLPCRKKRRPFAFARQFPSVRVKNGPRQILMAGRTIPC
jgi:hypothetical protein